MDRKDILERNQKIKDTFHETRLRRKEQVCKVYTVKVDKSQLSKVQKEQLDGMRREAKWYWNDLVNKSDWKVVGKGNEVKPWDYKINSKEVDVFNPKTNSFERRQVKYIPTQSIQKLQARFCSNIKTLASLKKKGLKVGKIKRCSSQGIVEFKQFFKIKSSRGVKIPGVSGNLKVSGLKQFLGIPNLELAASLTLIYEWSNDDYYLKFCTYQPKGNIKKDKIDETIGIDMGCETSFTLSNGEKFNFEFAESDRIKRYQRKLDSLIFQKDHQGNFLLRERTLKNGKVAKEKIPVTKRSNNSRKIQAKLKREHIRLNRKKEDASNKLLAYLRRYKTIVIQNEQLQNWQMSGHGKAVHNSILGRVKEELMKWDNVIVLGKKIPTTKLCTNCGQYHDEMTVKDRRFICDCGVKMDRDVHAARNMVWFYKNNIGVERTDLKRVDVARLVAEALDDIVQCSERVRQGGKDERVLSSGEFSSLTSRTVVQHEATSL